MASTSALQYEVMFDEHGRCDPRGLKSDVCPPNRAYYLARPFVNYRDRLSRLKHAGLQTEITPDEFEYWVENLQARLKQSIVISNLAKGILLPLVIPKAKEEDLGLVMEDYVARASNALRNEFSHLEFLSSAPLTGRLVIEKGGRQERLISRLAQKSEVALYYPLALQGFSVDAQREQAGRFPSNLVLSGVRGTSIGIITYPDVLARDYHTPAYDCSAALAANPTTCYCYKVASPDVVSFFERRGSSYAVGRHTGGLLFVA